MDVCFIKGLMDFDNRISYIVFESIIIYFYNINTERYMYCILPCILSKYVCFLLEKNNIF